MRLRFFQHGPFEGKRIQTSPQPGIRSEEPANDILKTFYQQLISILRQALSPGGAWKLLECTPAWEGNWTHDCFITFSWELTESWVLFIVNYSPYRSRGFVKLPFEDLSGKTLLFKDLFSGVTWQKEGDELLAKGLYLDEPSWKYYVFTIEKQ